MGGSTAGVMRFRGLLTVTAAFLLCLKVVMVMHSSIRVSNMPFSLESSPGGAGGVAGKGGSAAASAAAASAGQGEQLESSSCCQPQCGGYKDGSYLCLCCTKHYHAAAPKAAARAGGGGGGSTGAEKAQASSREAASGGLSTEGHQEGQEEHAAAEDSEGQQQEEEQQPPGSHTQASAGGTAAAEPEGRYGVFAGMAGPASGSTCCHATCLGVKSVADYRCGCCTDKDAAVAAEGQEQHGQEQGHEQPTSRHRAGGHQQHSPSPGAGREGAQQPAVARPSRVEAQASSAEHHHHHAAPASPQAHSGPGGRAAGAASVPRREGGGGDGVAGSGDAMHAHGDAFAGGTNQVFRDTHNEGGVLRSRRGHHGRQRRDGGGRQGLLAEYESLKAQGLEEAKEEGKDKGKGGGKEERRPLSWDKSWWEPKAWALWFFSGPSLTILIFTLNAMTQGWQCGMIYVAILLPLDVMTFYFDLYAYDEGDLLWIEFALAIVLNGLLCACLLPAYAASQMMYDDRASFGGGYGGYQDPYGGPPPYGQYGATGAGSGFNPFQGQGQSTGYNGGYGVRTERTQLV